jgi:hypothetical protein
MPRDEAVAKLEAMFGNADFARSALETWAGFVTEPEVVTTAVAEVTRPAIPRVGRRARRRLPVGAAACRSSLPAEQRADR